MNEDELRGQLIARLREDRLWTREELARRAGVTPTTVSQAEAGRTHVRLRTIGKLAEALGVPASTLLRPSEEKEPALSGKDEAPIPSGQKTPEEILRGPALESIEDLLERAGATTRHLAAEFDDLRRSCDGLSEDEVRQFHREVLVEKQKIGPVLDQRYNTPPGEKLARLNALWIEQFNKGWAAAGAVDRRLKEIAATKSSEEAAEALRQESAERAHELFTA